MEIIAALIAVISPSIITQVTELTKKAKTVQFSEYRKTILRAVVALLALASAVGSALLTDNPVPEELITGAVQAILVAIGATGIYFWDKYRTAQEEGRIAR